MFSIFENNTLLSSEYRQVSENFKQLKKVKDEKFN